MHYKAVFTILFSGLLLLASACSDDSGAKPDAVTNDISYADSEDGLDEVGHVVEKQEKIRLVIKEAGLKMHTKPSMEGDARFVIPYGERVNLLYEKGEELTIGGRTGAWSRVDWNGYEGWVFGGFLIEVGTYLEMLEEKQKNARLVDAESGLRMRDKPTLDGKVLCVIPHEDSVMLLEEQGEEKTIGERSGVWSRVQWNEQTGWVFGGFLIGTITGTITVGGEDIEVELFKGTKKELMEMFTHTDRDECDFRLLRAGRYEKINFTYDRKKEKARYVIIRDMQGVFDEECGDLLFETNNSFTCIPDSDEPFNAYMSFDEISRYITKKTIFRVWTKKDDLELIIFSADNINLVNKHIQKLTVEQYVGMTFLQAMEELNNDGVPYRFIISESSEDQSNRGVISTQRVVNHSIYYEACLYLYMTKPDNIPEGKIFGLFKAKLPEFIIYKKVEVIAVSGEERTTLMSMMHPGGELSIPYILDEDAEITVLVDGEQRIKEKVEAY